jgi:hypothetical protein
MTITAAVVTHAHANVVPGHGEPGGRALLTHTLTLVDTSLAEVSGRFGGC